MGGHLWDNSTLEAGAIKKRAGRCAKILSQRIYKNKATEKMEIIDPTLAIKFQPE